MSSHVNLKSSLVYKYHKIKVKCKIKRSFTALKIANNIIVKAGETSYKQQAKKVVLK